MSTQIPKWTRIQEMKYVKLVKWFDMFRSKILAQERIYWSCFVFFWLYPLLVFDVMMGKIAHLMWLGAFKMLVNMWVMTFPKWHQINAPWLLLGCNGLIWNCILHVVDLTSLNLTDAAPQPATFIQLYKNISINRTKKSQINAKIKSKM